MPPGFHIHLTQNPGLTLDRSTNANIAISRSIHPILAILSLRGFPTYSPNHVFQLVKYPCFDLFLPFACILVGILGFWILDVGDGDGDRELCTYLGCCRCLGHVYDAWLLVEVRCECEYKSFQCCAMLDLLVAFVAHCMSEKVKSMSEVSLALEIKASIDLPIYPSPSAFRKIRTAVIRNLEAIPPI